MGTEPFDQRDNVVGHLIHHAQRIEGTEAERMRQQMQMIAAHAPPIRPRIHRKRHGRKLTPHRYTPRSH